MVEIENKDLIEFRTKLFERRPWDVDGDTEGMWNTMALCIRKVADVGKRKHSGGIMKFKICLR